MVKIYPIWINASNVQITVIIAQIITNVFHMDARMGDDYHCADLISDILSRGKSSRFYSKLIKENPRFIDLSAFVMGSLDNGLFVIAGKPVKGVLLKQAYQFIMDEINFLCENPINKRELEKVKNKIHSSLTFQEISNLNKAMSLGYYELFNEAEAINHEFDNYKIVDSKKVTRVARKLFDEKNSSVLFYKSKNND